MPTCGSRVRSQARPSSAQRSPACVLGRPSQDSFLPKQLSQGRLLPVSSPALRPQETPLEQPRPGEAAGTTATPSGANPDGPGAFARLVRPYRESRPSRSAHPASLQGGQASPPARCGAPGNNCGAFFWSLACHRSSGRQLIRSVVFREHFQCHFLEPAEHHREATQWQEGTRNHRGRRDSSRDPACASGESGAFSHRRATAATEPYGRPESRSMAERSPSEVSSQLPASSIGTSAGLPPAGSIRAESFPDIVPGGASARSGFLPLRARPARFLLVEPR